MLSTIVDTLDTLTTVESLTIKLKSTNISVYTLLLNITELAFLN